MADAPPRILIVNINLDPDTLEGCQTIAQNLQALGADTLIVHWAALLTPLGRYTHAPARFRPQGVILGPNATPFPAYPPAFDRFLSWVRRRRGPTLGICGGHQAIAIAHGAPVAPVHAVPAASTSYDGMPKLTGSTRIRIIGDYDPLLSGLNNEILVWSSHVDEVKDLPDGFRLLAFGDPSHVQIMRADRRPIWGVQFHPENQHSPDIQSAGQQILQNFVTLVR